MKYKSDRHEKIRRTGNIGQRVRKFWREHQGKHGLSMREWARRQVEGERRFASLCETWLANKAGAANMETRNA